MDLSVIPNISEVMVPDPQSVDLNAPVDKARHLMLSHEIRHLPVIDHGKVVGVISDRDVKLAAAFQERMGDEPVLVSDVCHLEPYTVAPSEKLDVVALSMAEMHIGSCLIVEQGKLIGIFTVTDACRWIGELFRSAQH